MKLITEERRGGVPLFVHPEWERTFPWLVQGTTGREAGNFASFGSQTAEALHERWRGLRIATGMRTCVLGRQVHGARVLEHGALSPGWLLADDSDGHISSARGVLMAVSIADCVPVLMVDPKRERVAVLHAGWRGTAAGIIRAGVEMMGSALDVHLGPGICGACYEVGPDVHAALGLPAPPRNTPIDLRAVLAEQCVALGIPEARISTSSWCTRCGETAFYSHRAGQPERQVAVIGVR
ncbi:MAG: polyphenol oxidase family protein [Gemmatimonadota bacterium]